MGSVNSRTRTPFCCRTLIQTTEESTSALIDARFKAVTERVARPPVDPTQETLPSLALYSKAS